MRLSTFFIVVASLLLNILEISGSSDAGIPVHVPVKPVPVKPLGPWSTSNLPPDPMKDPNGCGRLNVPHSAVCDPDILLSSDDKDVIEGRINLQFEDNLLAEVAVLVVGEIGFFSAVSTFAQKVHDNWGIGDKEKNNGILLFLSINQREIYISKGSGIPLRDSDLDSIINTMKPLCKSFRYASAIEIGLSQLSNMLLNPPKRESSLTTIIVVVSLICAIFFFIHYIEKRDSNHSRELSEGNRRMEHLMREIKGTHYRLYITFFLLPLK